MIFPLDEELRRGTWQAKADLHAARAAAYAAHQAARVRGASKDEATQEAMRAWDAIVFPAGDERPAGSDTARAYAAPGAEAKAEEGGARALDSGG